MKRLVSQTEETKYAASQIVTNSIVPLSSLIAPIGMITPVFQGATSNRRIGDKLAPTKMTTKFHFFFDRAFTTTIDVTIALYVLTHKSFKSMAGVLADPNVGNVWDNGSGTAAVGWDTVNPLISEMLRVDPTVYTVLKKKQIRLIRNVGLDNLDATPGNAPNIKQSVASYTYRHKKLPKFKYDGGAGLPSNYAPFFFAIAYRSDGSGPITNPELPNMSVRSELYFKDG